MGSGSTADADLFRYAFERGITTFDTAESYPLKAGGRAEKALGAAIQGKRDKVVLTSKVAAGKRMRRQQIMRRLEASLRRLGTDYVDVFLNHGVNNPARITNPEWSEFAAAAKQQGKIRFAGMSGHGGRLIECLDVALDQNLVDVILVAYNFGQDPAFYERFTKSFDIVALQPDLPRVLKKAHQKGVGVQVMKTLMGARLNDMRPYEWGGATFAQAAFRWVLQNPDVDGLVVSMKSRQQIDEYLAASGQRGVEEAELRLLQRYAAAHGASYCRHGCGVCESSCPNGVPVSEVLRARMYAVDYGELEDARAAYAELGSGAAPCLSCTEQSCLRACPHGLEVSTLTRSAAGLLAGD